MDIYGIITRLCEQPSPSGFEHTASKRAARIMSRFLDDVGTDAFGNVIGIRRSGVRGAKCLLLDAHIDEIGFITTGSRDGFLTFETLGGVDERMLPAREVTVLADPPLFGVITCAPPHLQSKDESEKAVPRDKLFIDVGLGAEEAKSLVPVGTPVVYDSGVVRLQNDCISARALDDRASFAALLHAIELLRGKKLALDIAVVGSVQEELGCRGAQVAGFSINPDYALVVDVTHATTPGADKSKTFDMGSGAAIGVGPNISKKLSDTLISIAKEKKLPHTIEVCEGDTGTNAWTLQTVREGIATALLSIPLKYMHTPVETLRKRDIEAVSKLIAEFAIHLGTGVTGRA